MHSNEVKEPMKIIIIGHEDMGYGILINWILIHNLTIMLHYRMNRARWQTHIMQFSTIGVKSIKMSAQRR